MILIFLPLPFEATFYCGDCDKPGKVLASRPSHGCDGSKSKIDFGSDMPARNQHVQRACCTCLALLATLWRCLYKS